MGKFDNKFREEKREDKWAARADHDDKAAARKGHKKGRPNKGNSEDKRNMKGCNSPDWLNHNPALIEAAGRVNFATRLGKAYTFSSENNPNPDPIDGALPNPSFMALYYVPTFGVSKDGTSAINLAALGLMTKMRTVISGSRSYDPSDLMLHVLAISNVIDAINIAVRAYGVATYYTPWDVTTPRQYLEAMGFDFGSVTNNMAFFNGLINKAIAKISNMAIPATIKYLNRHQALSSYIFADGTLVDRAQKYFYMPTHFYSLALEKQPTEEFAGYKLVPEVWNDPAANPDEPTLHTVWEWYDFVDQMIEAIITREDSWIIDGDIRKTYADNLVKLGNIPFDYAIAPTYDAGMSSQFENTTVVGFIPSYSMASDKSWELRQYIPENALLFNPTLQANVSGSLNPNVFGFATDQAILNFHWDNPSAMDVAYATQMTVCTSGDNQSTDTNWYFDSVGTEVVAYCRAYGHVPNPDRVANPYIFTHFDAGTWTPERAFYITSVLNCFDWHPQFIVFGGGSLSSATILGTSIDLDNWTLISRETLSQLHDAAMLSYFDVPQF